MTAKQEALASLRRDQHELENPKADLGALRTALNAIMARINSPAIRERIDNYKTAIEAIDALPEIAGYPIEIRVKALDLACDIWRHKLDPAERPTYLTEEAVDKMQQDLNASLQILEWYAKGSARHPDQPGMSGLSYLVSVAHDRQTKPIPGRTEPDIARIIQILGIQFPLLDGLTWQKYLDSFLVDDNKPLIAAINKYTAPPV